jgi:hypothetical protein
LQYLTTGIQQLGVHTPKLYPNPAKEFIQVNLRNGASWQLFDLSGRLAASGKNESDSFEIILSGLQPGIYCLKLEQMNRVYTSKVAIGAP